MPVDRSTGIYWETHGRGPGLFVGLPLMASHVEIFGPQAQAMIDAWRDGLADRYTLLLADYPGIGRSADHDPGAMTAQRVVGDLLSVADAAGFDRFAWAGYSWSGAVGLQIASRSDRLTALAIGGWPPREGPYDAILAASRARIGHVPDSARVILRSDDQYRQWAAFYASLADWDEADALAAIACPRLLYFGSQGDLVEAGHPVPVASRCRAHRAALESEGWEVHEIAGFGHDVIGQSDLIVAMLRDFLQRSLA